MHFALPPRKTSFPPPYARVSARNVNNRRRKQLQYLSYLVLGVLTVVLCFKYLAGLHNTTQHGPVDKDSTVVIVTVLDHAKMSDEYISMVKKNRDDYAARHGETIATRSSKALAKSCRILDLLHKHIDLFAFDTSLAILMGSHTSSTTCFDAFPRHGLRLVTHASCSHHESFFIPLRSCFEESHEFDVERHTCGSA